VSLARDSLRARAELRAAKIQELLLERFERSAKRFDCGIALGDERLQLLDIVRKVNAITLGERSFGGHIRITIRALMR